MRGAFVTLEGGEGVGKTTNLALILAHLDTRGVEVVATREPGGTPLGETIRAWILDGEHGALSAEVEALLMFAARARHLDTVIRPALAAGKWVVCDRFTDATFAYQGGGRGADTRLLEALETGVQRGLEPDLTLLLDAPLEVGRRRIAARAPDHFEREQAPFFERVRRAYLERAQRDPKRVKVIDAAGAARASAGRHRPRARRTARSVRKMTEPGLQTLQRRLCPWLKGALSLLETAYAAQRLGHAWLIAGPAGSGKLNLALVFARRLLERGASQDPPDLGPEEAVAAYADRHTPADHHPDLHWLFPEEDKTAISVEQIRGLSAELSLKAHAGGAKVVIFEPADGMTTAAANALLKSLEEPSADTYLLLLAHQPGRLPATIRSRCQRLDVARPTPTELAAWLGVAREDLAAAWTLTGGAPLLVAAVIAGR